MFGWQLLAVLLAGAAARAILIVLTPGEYWDIDAIGLVGGIFAHDPLHLYQVIANHHSGHYQGLPTFSWPYPPGYLPFTAAIHWLSTHLGASVSRLDRGLISLADLALAWVLQAALGRLGYGHRQRLAAAALVSLGPTFIAVAGVHGQIDSLAWLPVVAAFALWTDRRRGWEPLACGALVGLGIDVKAFPVLALVALAPTTRDRRELVHLILGAVAVVGLSLAPFALTTTTGLGAIASAHLFPGRAGLTVLLQPHLTLHELAQHNPNVAFDAVTRFLLFHSTPILIVLLAAGALVAHLRGLRPPDVIAALILVLYVFSPAVLPQYWLWLVPFLVLGGRLWAAAAYQLAMLPLLVINYGFLQEPDQPDRHLSNGFILHVYVPLLWVVSLGLLAALVALLMSGPGRRPAPVPWLRQSMPANSSAQELMQ